MSQKNEIDEMIELDIKDFRDSCILESFGTLKRQGVKLAIKQPDTDNFYRMLVERVISNNGRLSFSELFDILNSTYFESSLSKDKMNSKWVESGNNKYEFDINVPGKRLSLINFLSNQTKEDELFIENLETKQENDPVVERKDERGEPLDDHKYIDEIKKIRRCIDTYLKKYKEKLESSETTPASSEAVSSGTESSGTESSGTASSGATSSGATSSGAASSEESLLRETNSSTAPTPDDAGSSWFPFMASGKQPGKKAEKQPERHDETWGEWGASIARHVTDSVGKGDIELIYSRMDDIDKKIDDIDKKIKQLKTNEQLDNMMKENKSDIKEILKYETIIRQYDGNSLNNNNRGFPLNSITIEFLHEGTIKTGLIIGWEYKRLGANVFKIRCDGRIITQKLKGNKWYIINFDKESQGGFINKRKSRKTKTIKKYNSKRKKTLNKRKKTLKRYKTKRYKSKKIN